MASQRVTLTVTLDIDLDTWNNSPKFEEDRTSDTLEDVVMYVTTTVCNELELYEPEMPFDVVRTSWPAS